MLNFFKMSDKEIILLSAEIAILLIENLNVDEQNTLGNFLMSVGQDIILGAGQTAIRENNKNNNKTDSRNIQETQGSDKNKEK